MRRGISKAVSAMVAAALACSMAPASAFAADADVSYGSGSNTTVGIRLTAPQINVQAPVRITFGDAEALDIDTYDGSEMLLDVKFINRTEKDVYLAAADVVQNNSANIGNVFDIAKINDANKPTFKSSRTIDSKTGNIAVSLTNATSGTTAFDFAGSSRVFGIGAATPTAEQSMTIQLGFSFGKEVLKNAQTLDTANSLKGNTTSICGIVWTFAINDEEEQMVDKYGGFFLLDGPTQQVYGVEEVKAHAEDIAIRGNTSQYYWRYLDYAKGNRDYTCRYAFKKDTLLNPGYTGETVRDMYIIGVYHDDRVDADGRIIGKAGLTFWMEEVTPFVCDEYLGTGSSTSIRGLWSESQVRLAYQPESNGGTGIFYDLIPDKVKQSIVPVYKQTYSRYSKGGYTFPAVTETIEYAFVPSAKEVGAHSTVTRIYPNRNPPEMETYEMADWDDYGAGAIAAETKMSKYEHDLSHWPFKEGYHRLLTRSAISDESNDGIKLVSGGWSVHGASGIAADVMYLFDWESGYILGASSLYYGMAFCF